MSDRSKDSGAKGKSTRSSSKGGATDGGKIDGPARGRSGKWGRVLRTAYDDALREPVPDEFLNLLGKLD